MQKTIHHFTCKGLFYCPLKWIAISLAFGLFRVGNAQVAISTDGSSPHASAMLEVKSTAKGFLPPRMTFAQRPLTPATGLLIYQTDVTPGFYQYDGSAWQRIGWSLNDYWLPNGSNIYFNSGRVAIGTNLSDGHGLNVMNYQVGKAAIRGVEGDISSSVSEGMLGILNYPANSLGLPYNVYNIGVLGIKRPSTYSGAAVYGWNHDGNQFNYGGIFISDGYASQNVNYGILCYGKNAGTNYGIYAVADSGVINYAGRFRGRVLLESQNANSGAADFTASLFSANVTHTGASDTRSIEGISRPQPGWGIGIYGEGGYKGVEGYVNGYNSSYTTYGVVGSVGGSSGGQGERIGVYGTASGGTSNYGVYGYAGSGAGNWAGYFSGSAYISSDLRIGTFTKATGYALSINGMIACTEVLVENPSNWPDFVFSTDYPLMSLPEIEQHIQKDKHLPGVPSAEEIKDNGIRVSEMQKKLLEKIEELTLHLIRQNRQIEDLRQQIRSLQVAGEKTDKILRSKIR